MQTHNYPERSRRGSSVRRFSIGRRQCAQPRSPGEGSRSPIIPRPRRRRDPADKPHPSRGGVATPVRDLSRVDMWGSLVGGDGAASDPSTPRPMTFDEAMSSPRAPPVDVSYPRPSGDRTWRCEVERGPTPRNIANADGPTPPKLSKTVFARGEQHSPTLRNIAKRTPPKLSKTVFVSSSRRPQGRALVAPEAAGRRVAGVARRRRLRAAAPDAGGARRRRARAATTAAVVRRPASKSRRDEVRL